MGLAIVVSRLPLSKVRRRCQWKGLYDDVAEFVKSREECERCDRNLCKEPLKPTWMAMVWAKVGVDVAYMPPAPGEYRFIVFARVIQVDGWKDERLMQSILGT